VAVLHREGWVGVLPVLPSIASAFDKVDARNRRHRHEITHRQDQRLLHHPVDQQPMLGGIQIGYASLAALIVQIRWRDRSHQLVQRCLRIDRIVGVDMTQPRARFRDTAEMDILLSLTVTAQRRSRFARRHIGQQIRQSYVCDCRPCDAAEVALRNRLRERLRSSWMAAETWPRGVM